jgi:transcriptional regulator with XRE-family HTH domain
MVNKKIGKKLRAQRKKLEISQSELAKRVKTPRTHIVAIEMGRRGVGVRLLSRISIVLGVQINFFTSKGKAVQKKH